MKYKLILGIVFLMLVLPIVNAQEFIPHQQFTNLTFSITSNNATSCNVSDYIFPGGVVSLNESMSRVQQTFSAKITANNFSVSGDYCFNIVCFDGVGYDTGSYCREITPSGLSDTLGFHFLILILSAGVIVLGFWITDGPIVILGSFGLYFIAYRILFFGIDGIRDPIYTLSIGSIILMVAAYISIKSSYELIID